MSSRTPLKGVTANLKRPRQLLVVIGIGIVVCLFGVSLFKATRPQPVSTGGSSSPTPAPLAAALNSPSPTPLVSQASPSPSPSGPELLAAAASPVPIPTAAPSLIQGSSALLTKPSVSLLATPTPAASPIASGGTPSASATPSPSVNEQPAEAAVPPPPHVYANDYANLLRPETLALLNARLADYERQTSNQFLLVIFARLPTSEDVSVFALKAFRAWKPGLAGRNNGAILFVFVQNRKVRIEVGLGLEQTLSNDTCKHIITDIIAPAFKAGDFDRGVLDGMQAMMAAAKDAYKGDGHTHAELRKIGLYRGSNDP